MTIIFLVVLFVFVVVFFWFIWKSSDDWRWYHLLVTSLIFLLMIPLLPMTAVVLRSRTVWSKQVTDLQERLEAAERTRADLISGVPNDPDLNPGLLELQSELRGLNFEVGRVFRDLEVRDRNQNGFVLGPAANAQPAGADGLPPDPAANAADAGAADPLALGVGNVVYAFAEQQTSPEIPPLPVFYLGEYRVSQADGTTVTLVPTTPLEPEQLQQANNAPRWSLYELMPTDGHEAFIAAGSTPDDDQLFGRVDATLVQNLLGGNVPPETLDRYLRDGSQARPDDPPATRWVKVEFTQPYQLTVDAMEQRSAIDGGFFDGLGQAVDSRLQREETDSVSFEPGDTLVVKSEAADALFAEGVAELVDEYFVRPLNSYRITLKELRQQIDYLNSQSEDLRRQQAVLQSALTLTTEMQTKGQQRKLELEKDEAQLAKEVAAISQYVDQLTSKLSEAKTEMAQLYQSNLESERELAAIQARIRQAAEQRGSEAVGS